MLVYNNINFKLRLSSGIEDQLTPYTVYYQNNQKVVAVICLFSEGRQPSIIMRHLNYMFSIYGRKIRSVWYSSGICINLYNIEELITTGL